MNKKDLERFARVEQQIIDQGFIHQISEQTDFPYKSFDELKSAHENKDISFGSNYNGDFIRVIGTTGQIVANAVWVSLPIIIIIADIVLAIIFKQWILLLGVLFAFIGFLSSSPFSPMKNIVSGLGGIMFVYSFFNLEWTWTFILGSLLFSQIFLLTAREQYRDVVEERALQSEVFFCYMLKNKHILVKDTSTNRIYSVD